MPDVLEVLAAMPCRPSLQWSRQRRLSGIEDYLFIGGDKLPQGLVAKRLGVSVRTVQRYRQVLREAARP